MIEEKIENLTKSLQRLSDLFQKFLALADADKAKPEPAAKPKRKAEPAVTEQEIPFNESPTPEPAVEPEPIVEDVLTEEVEEVTLDMVKGFVRQKLAEGILRDKIKGMIEEEGAARLDELTSEGLTNLYKRLQSL